ncbi:transcriptional regulator [Bacillus sp. HMF5848]|uniref:two-component system regulatory protein YycI n=1 Tax=Bacillus sp. HMF5848 TaxID=2495421 RepID=UPI000F7943B6|nr:two-component system regulatory protein YycI [Bacillus sp. HMF5848]RSK29168.1 transcriptional regulator [Bacillus sp. HMF5848]
MDWYRIKTIFIITFLVLNIFLGYQLYQKRNSSQLDIMTEATLEEQLATDEITYIDLPKDNLKGKYISAKSKAFSQQDLEKLDQHIVALPEPTRLQVRFAQPIPIPESNAVFFFNQFVKEQVINGTSYQLWNFNLETRAVTYIQVYNTKPIYHNVGGALTLFIDAENRIIGYEQTLLESITEFEEEKEILPAIKAIEILYDKNLLKPGSRVTRAEIGYYTLVQLTASQVLTPTWHIVINDKSHYYINAFEGQIINDDTSILE